MIADRHLWLDKSRSLLLEEGDPAADFCLSHRGSEVPEVEVARLRLAVDAEGHVYQESLPAEPESSAPLEA